MTFKVRGHGLPLARRADGLAACKARGRVSSQHTTRPGAEGIFDE
jgi:hypothetical protein